METAGVAVAGGDGAEADGIVERSGGRVEALIREGAHDRSFEPPFTVRDGRDRGARQAHGGGSARRRLEVIFRISEDEIDALPDGGKIWRAIADASPPAAEADTGPVLPGSLVIHGGPEADASLRAFVERITAIGVSLCLDRRIGPQPDRLPATG